MKPPATANGSAHRPPALFACQPKPNGNWLPVEDSSKRIFPGETPRRSLYLTTATRWQNGPEPVARYAPNAFGLYDIGDNVHEWCSDWYDPNYYAISPERNPQRPRAKPHEAATQVLPRRLLAPPHQGSPLLCPLQHPPRIPIRRLRLSRRQKRVAPASRRLSKARLALALRTQHTASYNLPFHFGDPNVPHRPSERQAHPHHRRRHRPRQRHGRPLPRTRSHSPHLRPPRRSS